MRRRAWALPSMDRGCARGEALPARGPRRAALPREVRDRLRRLEPAVRRDDGEPALHRRRQGAGDRADAQPACRTATAPSARRPRRWRRRFKTNVRTFALVTNTLAKDKEISDRWRGFKDVADSRHLNNRVEREVVDALVTSVRAAYPRLSHRYYKLKAAGSARKSSRYWDRNAPLPFAGHRQHRLARGEEHGADGLSRLLAGDGQHRRRFFNDRWIDAPVRPGKAPGAFAHPTVPSAHPYVLVNYQGKPRDVMTLAHELGHGVHQVLAAKQRGTDGVDAADAGRDRQRVRRDADLPRLLAETDEAKQRKAMLAGKVEDMINTVVRQIAFYTLRAQGAYRAQEGRTDGGAPRRNLARACRARASGRRSPSRPGYEISGCTSRTSSTRRSTSTPMRSAIAW